MRPRSPTSWFVIGVGVTGLAAGVAILLVFQTGGSQALEVGAPLIAAVIALGGVGTAQAVGIALANERAQGEALQTYLTKMSELLLDKCLHKKSDDFDAVRVTARLQTLAVLEQLDGGRKRTVLMFLREAQLIYRIERSATTDIIGPDGTPEEHEVLFYAHYVGLREADLSNANLQEARLISASGEHPVSLKGANLKGANLSGAKLCGADLSDTDLRKADLRCADLSVINVADNGKPLHKADLSGADLRRAKHLTQDQLEQTNGDEKTKLPPGLKRPDHWKAKTGE